MIVNSVFSTPWFSVKGKSNEYAKMNAQMQKETFNSQLIKPKGCQPLKPLEQDTFVRSSKVDSPKADLQDTFVKSSEMKPEQQSPFTKTPESDKSVQEFSVTSKPGSNVSFGYKHALKTAWRKGLLPTVTKGLYGNKLTKANVSLEHITPVSQGGKTVLENLALADRMANMQRGVKPIADVISFEQLMEYLEQFRDVKAIGINGNSYIKKIIEQATKVWNMKP